ncbi:MAG: SocA family protein [Ignavibacteriales bacterium]|nr:SocA family protein [Ignavibacteriales bacterium]
MKQQVNNRLEFDEEKAIEAILYIAQQTSDLYKILKAIYWADKFHIDEYQRFIFGERYARLPHGVTPSDSYDILKGIRGDGNPEYDEYYGNDIEIKDKIVTAKRNPEVNYLSKSDIECLDKAIDKVLSKSFSENKKNAHDKTYDADSEHFISLMDFIVDLPQKDKILRRLQDTFV